MACFKPVQGYEYFIMNPSGKYSFTRIREHARILNGKPVSRVVPCRKCIGCRYDLSREWATKIQLEASMHYCNRTHRSLNSFITLTYNDDHIPLYGGLDYFGHWQSFLKRLRRRLEPIKIRFFMIGEYGDLNLRPHYHAIIFGYDFPDKRFHISRNGHDLYRSQLLEEVWTVPRGQPRAGESLGYASVGSVSFASAAYCARYSMKKDIGLTFDGVQEVYNYESGEVGFIPKISERYVRYNQETGEKVIVAPERHLMSNRDGIGKTWFDTYAKTDMFVRNSDGSYKDFYHLSDGKVVRSPKYFDKLLDKCDPELMESIKRSRQDYMSSHANEFTPERLAAREVVLASKMKRLKRDIRNVYAT